MIDPTLEQRIDRLDAAMADLAREVALTERDRRAHRAENRRQAADWNTKWAAILERDREQSADWQARWEADRRRSEERQARWEAGLANDRQRYTEWQARWEADREDDRRQSEEWQARWEAGLADDRQRYAEWQARWEAGREDDRRKSDEWQTRWEATLAEDRQRNAEWQARWEAGREDDRRQSEQWQARWEAGLEENRQQLVQWRAESEAFRQEMRRESGELSRRLGTMAEDLVAPGVGRVLRTFIDAAEEDISSVAVRVRRRSPLHRGRMVEFDVVAVCGDTVLINETKSQLASEHIPAFVKRLDNVREYFPEFADKRILGAIASLYVDASLVRLGERRGLIVLGFGHDLMDVLNTPGFTPRSF